MIVNFLISFVLVFGAWYKDLPLIDIKTASDVVSIISTIVQVSAVMVGFLVTAYSILLSISDKPLLQNMNATGHYSFLLRRLFYSAMFFTFNLLTGLYLILIQSPQQWLFNLFLIFMLIALVIFISAARLFFKVVSNL